MVFRRLDIVTKEKLQDSEWLRQNLINMSVQQIADLLDVNKDSVRYYMDKFGLIADRRRVKHIFINDIECKQCSKCHDWKPLTDFCRSKKTWDGLGSHCLIDRQKRHQEQNTPQARARIQKRRTEREKEDLNYRLKRRLNSRIYHTTFRGQKSAPTLSLLGCDLNEFKKYLEERFLPGMTWENYGRDGWEIDHVRPCKSFDLTDPEQQRICYNYTNLQPLWAAQNRAKGAKE